MSPSLPDAYNTLIRRDRLDIDRRRWAPASPGFYALPGLRGGRCANRTDHATQLDYTVFLLMGLLGATLFPEITLYLPRLFGLH